MAFVVTLRNFRPVPRYDSAKWTSAVIQEAATALGTWADVEEFAIADYADPTAPPELSFTTDAATLNPALGWFRIAFYDVADNVSFSSPVGPSGYPTTEELVAASTITELTTLSETEQDALRESSINAIEEFCNQSFMYEPDSSYYVDGAGTGVLYLPRRIVTLTAITIPDSSISLSDILINDLRDRLFLQPGNNPLTNNYYSAAIRELSGSWPMRFTYGTGNILIEGDFGWSAVPAPVKVAIRKDMEDTALADANGLSNTARAFRKMGMRDVSQGNLRATVTGAWGLSPEVMGLLDRYVWIGPLGSVA